jgi:hypothetical protein
LSPVVEIAWEGPIILATGLMVVQGLNRVEQWRAE